MTVRIDGNVYEVPVIRLRRKAEFLDKSAERTVDGDLKRELIGVYFNFQLELGRSDTEGEYQALWAKLTEAEPFHTVVIPNAGISGEDYSFTAYFSNVADELIKEKATSTWKGLTVNFIAKMPARIP